MKKYPLIHQLTIIGTLLIAVFIGISIYWLVIEPDVMIVKNADALPVNKEVYSPGEKLEYTITYCKRKVVTTTLSRSLVDTYQITYPSIRAELPVGCNSITRRDLVVPSFITGGENHKFHLEGISIVKINPLREQYVTWRTVDFIIK